MVVIFFVVVFRFGFFDTRMEYSLPSKLHLEWHDTSQKTSCAQFCLAHTNCSSFIYCHRHFCGVFYNKIGVNLNIFETLNGCSFHTINNSTAKILSNEHSINSTQSVKSTTQKSPPLVAFQTEADRLADIFANIKIRSAELTFGEAVEGCNGDSNSQSSHLFYEFEWTGEFMEKLGQQMSNSGILFDSRYKANFLVGRVYRTISSYSKTDLFCPPPPLPSLVDIF